jgi:hypothetical protein
VDLEERTRDLLKIFPRTDWPDGLIATFQAVDARLEQSAYAPLFADIVRAWVWSGAERALPFDEAFTLAQTRPWIAEMEADEAARKAAEQMKRDEAEQARGDVGKLLPTPTVEELAAVVGALQKQVDWLMEKVEARK